LFGLGVADIAQVDHLHGERSHQVRIFAEVRMSDYAHSRQPDHVVLKHCSEGSATSDAIALMDAMLSNELTWASKAAVFRPGTIGSLLKYAVPALPIGYPH
jgi:hypothetical protein